MTFSRGLYSGWMHGVNHQELVSARYGKKRGAFAGRIARVGRDSVEFVPEVPLKPGDGVVFDTGGDTNAEQGGRIFEIKGPRLFFQRDHIDFARLKTGDRCGRPMTRNSTSACGNRSRAASNRAAASG